MVFEGEVGPEMHELSAASHPDDRIFDGRSVRHSILA